MKDILFHKQVEFLTNFFFKKLKAEKNNSLSRGSGASCTDPRGSELFFCKHVERRWSQRAAAADAAAVAQWESSDRG